MWPWQHCPARAYLGPNDAPRCDLHEGHEGLHQADRGMFSARWIEVEEA